MTAHPNDTSATEPIRVLFIGGFMRSGSTIIDRALGTVSGVTSVGELRWIWTTWLDPSYVCACGSSVPQCPFWKAVVSETIANAPVGSVEEIRQTQLQVDRWWRSPQLARGWYGRRYRRRLTLYLNVLRHLYTAVREVSGSGVIVDSSKDPSYAYLLWRAGLPIDLRLIHLIRDSRGVVYSSGRPKIDPGRGTYLKSSGTVRTSLAWTAANLLFEPLKRTGIRCAPIRYESFARQPRVALTKMLSLVDCDPSEIPVEPDGSITLKAAHNIEGNPIRYEQGRAVIQLDERWRDEMPLSDWLTTTALTWPLLARYRRYEGSVQSMRLTP